MGAVVLIFLTAFVSMICGAVMLIQIGGWLPTLVAILLILQWFLGASVLVILIGGAVIKKEKKEIQQ